MVEVLVAAAVLSVGLLGMAVLQVKSMRANYDSQLYSIAATQAKAMVDRMRANSSGVAAGYYDSMSPGTPTQAQTDSLSCSGCSTAQVAMRDYQEWSQANAAQLPLGRGSVIKSGSIYRITVMWDSKKTGVTGTGCSGNPNVDLTCLRVDTEL